ncbi:MAG: hypothetical protein HRU24_01830 [Gammaproteobacteria bacterium]|nr:hypothetical protein [Gammaproteobacteria bacterium]
MMIRLLILALIVFTGLLVGPMLIDQKGYVLIAVNDWTIETSVVVMVMMMLVFYALLQLLEWSIVNTLTFWGRTRNWFGWRRQKIAREKTLVSVLDLAQGDFSIAEKNSARNARLSEKPLLNYLTAAQAAQQQGKIEQRDHYLQCADDLDDGQLAVDTTRLKLHIDADEYQQALDWLSNQTHDTLRQKSILRYAYLVYVKLERWEWLLSLLPAVQKQQIIDQETAEKLFQDCHRGMLQQAATQGLPALKDYYQSLSRKMRNDIDVFTDYAKFVIMQGGLADVETLIFKRLRKKFDLSLLQTLETVSVEESERIYEDVAQLTRQYPAQVAVFTLAGRFSIGMNHWPKAKEWFTLATAIEPTQTNYQCLALAQAKLGENNGALTHYQRAIEMGA